MFFLRPRLGASPGSEARLLPWERVLSRLTADRIPARGTGRVGRADPRVLAGLL